MGLGFGVETSGFRNIMGSGVGVVGCGFRSMGFVFTVLGYA